MEPHPAVARFKAEQRWRLVRLGVLHEQRQNTLTLLADTGLDALARGVLENDQRSLETQIGRTVVDLRLAWDATRFGVPGVSDERAGTGVSSGRAVRSAAIRDQVALADSGSDPKTVAPRRTGQPSDQEANRMLEEVHQHCEPPRGQHAVHRSMVD
jgi:hypothetical protein